MTGGQAHDITQAIPLIDSLSDAYILGDKGDDSEAFIAQVHQQNCHPVIPPRRCRQEARSCDWHLYKERHLVECFFNRIKHFRRIATRYEKTARNYLAMLHFAAVLVWLNF